MPVLDDLGHLAIEEGEQQRADVRAVDVGVGHDDDLVIAQFCKVEFVADAGAERLDQRADFLGRDDPVRSEEHTSELQSLMRISYAVFCLKKKINPKSRTPVTT